MNELLLLQPELMRRNRFLILESALLISSSLYIRYESSYFFLRIKGAMLSVF
jgi:hypothetical protein